MKNDSQSLTLRECLIGDRSFYRHVAIVVLPIIVQNTLSNVVGLLDNVMVGQVGTLPMSAVAIVNQFMFVFNLCVWGALAGAGIFGAQFYGQGNMEGVRQTLRIKLVTGLGLVLVAFAVLLTCGSNLVGLYIADGTSAADAAATMDYALSYLRVMLPGLIPFAITQAYAGTLRESGQTSLPMKASMIAMGVNFVFNCLLIFGLLGFPCLGVVGAGIATSLSRFVECVIVVSGAHRSTERYPFMAGLYRGFAIDGALVRNVIMKGAPLLLNECLWSISQATLLQCYSVRGIQVIAAMNITGTITQIFNEVFLSLGNATAILVGQELGANRMTGAQRTAWRMISLSVASCFVMGGALAICSPFIPHIYNTEPEIRMLASEIIRMSALCMPLFAFANAAYFTLRSGGKTFITFLFDSCFTWVVTVPLAFVLSRYTSLPVMLVYLFVNAGDIIKCAIGFVLVKKGVWVNNIVGD
ncbi:MAG: MATE family efflux transporter [Oscillospiraceae bacterium]|nr:MATE family efflux transporter [Oscillospiraceae bacterium]